MRVFVYNKSNFFGVVDICGSIGGHMINFIFLGVVDIYGSIGDHILNLSNVCPLGWISLPIGKFNIIVRLASNQDWSR